MGLRSVGISGLIVDGPAQRCTWSGHLCLFVYLLPYSLVCFNGHRGRPEAVLGTACEVGHVRWLRLAGHGEVVSEDDADQQNHSGTD